MLRAGGCFYQAELLIDRIQAGYLYAEMPHTLLQRAEGSRRPRA